MSSMKKSDLLSMAVQNLKNRRSRTKLTVIGVIIGTCSIVIMVSIGVGINNTITSMFSTSSVAKISVSSPKYFDSSDNNEEKKRSPLDDSAVEYLKSIKDVDSVVPIIKLTDGVNVTRGKYTSQNATIIGIDFNDLEKFGVKFKEGEKINSDFANIAYFGDSAVTGFTDRQGNPVKFKFNENNEIAECEINPMTDTFFISAVDNSNLSKGTVNAPQEKLRVEGVLEADKNSGLDASNAIYVSTDFAKKLINDYNRITTGEKKSSEYTEIYVYVNDIDNVKDVQSNISLVGLESYSDQDSLDYTKKIMTVVQLVLGAIGAISMFVAAFGISNTMVMAVYERTKEIGVMKVIGCDIKDIKALFLYEAGIIGLAGGAIGVAISWVVSVIANIAANVVMSSMMEGESASVTVASVPWWLALIGVGFSTGIGVISGLSPASRAVKVSALKAIHNE